MISTRDQGSPMTYPRAESPALVCLWTTGSDPRLDGLVRIKALRVASSSPGDGMEGFGPTTSKLKEPKEPKEWEELDLICDPFPGRPGHIGAAGTELFRRFGLGDQDLTGALHAAEAWAKFEEFVGPRPILVDDAQGFLPWQNAFSVPGGPVIGMEELERIATLRFESASSGDSKESERLQPKRLAERLGALVDWLQLGDPLFVGLWAHGLLESAHRMLATDPDAGARLQWMLGTLDRPAEICGQGDGLFEAGRATSDGWLHGRVMDVSEPEFAVLGLTPRGTIAAGKDAEHEAIPPTAEGLTVFPKEDKKKVQEVFDIHLPECIAETQGGTPEQYLRPAQRDVALRIADNMGRNGLLLVHAPTGTGKTLAYIVPTLLWAVRHNVRVGVATYTRALQEQAMDREVPRALQALRRAGVDPLPRVSLLKGRENYLCWRAFTPQVPQADDDAETWLAWTVLLTFAITDEFGDLDRLNSEPPFRLTSARPYREAIGKLLRITRARKGCCSKPKDRSTCLAELARRRAEHSHLVITNQSFVLARQEFLRHIIFDECEHLHDGAVSAWSHRFEFEDARRVMIRLHRPGRGSSRAPLDRLVAQLPKGGSSREYIDRALGRWDRVAKTLNRMEEEAEFFEGRRHDATAGRSEREVHGYLRQRFQQGEEAGLLQGRLSLGTELGQLERDLDRVLEVVDSNKLRGEATIRRQVELARTDLIELSKTLNACIPIGDEGPSFAREVFYDVERHFRGGLALVARVLLPFETLGRYYYPDLASAAFLSATTYLEGGFEASKGYLGLQRAEEPAPDEERIGRPVETFRVPEVFDYSRVLVGVPRDCPPANGPRQAHRQYVADFVGQLAERTGGRLLVLFTSLEDVRHVGEALQERLMSRGLTLLYQGMRNLSKEELSRSFRERRDSVLLGVDTFWFGADFPGDTLQYLAIARLPYGVPDRYHFAQCAALGDGPQRQKIYMPRALAKFRQGFGRLMRRKEDRGCVFLLDPRILEPRHRAFLRELPLAGLSFGDKNAKGAALVRGPRDRIMREALGHMGLLNDLERRGMDLGTWQRDPGAEASSSDSDPNLPNSNSASSHGTLIPQRPKAQTQKGTGSDTNKGKPPRSEPFTPPIDVDPSDLPF